MRLWKISHTAEESESVHGEAHRAYVRRFATSCALVTVARVVVAGCLLPGTYYDSSDSYVRGMRFFDRGQHEVALRLWSSLADGGDCDAQYRLGTLYFLGAGVQRDLGHAREWWREAANQGQWRAQFALSTMESHDKMVTGSIVRQFVIDCTNGCDVPKDVVQTYYWAHLAETAARAESDTVQRAIRQRVDELTRVTTPEDRAEADRLRALWKAAPSECTPRRLL